MGADHIHCRIRRRSFVRTPEEEVRQALLNYLIEELDYPAGRFSVESMVMIHGIRRRTDILVHDETGATAMIIECKAPKVPLDQKTVSQIANYNFALGAPYLMLSNGHEHHLFHLDIGEKRLEAMEAIPRYEHL